MISRRNFVKGLFAGSAVAVAGVSLSFAGSKPVYKDNVRDLVVDVYSLADLPAPIDGVVYLETGVMYRVAGVI